MITPKGQRLWRMKYRQGDKERLLAFGIYPNVTLAQAREKRDAAKALLAQGIDPSEHQKEVAAAKKRMDEEPVTVPQKPGLPSNLPNGQMKVAARRNM